MEDNVIKCGKIREVFPIIDENKALQEPIGRSGHCCVADESNLYVFGGYNPRAGPLITGHGAATYFTPCRQVMAELWVFNFATRIWKKINSSDTPKAAASSCMKLVGKKLFVYGGTVFPFGHLMSNSLHICDLTHGYRWETVDSGGTSYEYPPKAYGQSIVLHENALYTFGGAINFYMEPVSDLHRLHLSQSPSTRQWERLKPSGEIPRGRYKQEVIMDTNRFLVLGGGHLAGAESLEKLHAYNYEEDSWSLQGTTPDSNHGFPKPRSCFGCVQRGNLVIICGGRYYDWNQTKFEGTSDIWTLTIDTLQWTKLDFELPTDTYFHGVGLSTTGVLYIYGGIVDGDLRTSKLYSVQLFFPKLVELCWQRVVDSIPNIHTVPQKAIYELGIPHDFVCRLKS